MTVESTIKVQGMSCGNCKKAVESALTNLSGVKDVTVHLEDGSVVVNYHEDQVTLTEIEQEIEDQGYDVVEG